MKSFAANFSTLATAESLETCFISANKFSLGDKSLRQLEDPWLKEQVSAYTNIPIGEFERFSTVQSMNDLKPLRKKVFADAFDQTRDALYIG